MPRRSVRARATPRRALSTAQADARERALDVLHYMRHDGLSLRTAARAAGTTPRTVLKYAGAAVRRTASGRYQATKGDRLARTLHFLTPKGTVAVTVRGSRVASRIAQYSAAVDRFLTTGDWEALRPFAGKSLRVGRHTYPFITDRRVLARLGHAGELSFEDLYVH